MFLIIFPTSWIYITIRKSKWLLLFTILEILILEKFKVTILLNLLKYDRKKIRFFINFLCIIIITMDRWCNFMDTISLTTISSNRRFRYKTYWLYLCWSISENYNVFTILVFFKYSWIGTRNNSWWRLISICLT